MFVDAELPTLENVCREEIDIINDVVHYKSAYYGTIMVGNPPCSKIESPSHAEEFACMIRVPNMY